jgi:hypothetical protein
MTASKTSRRRLRLATLLLILVIPLTPFVLIPSEAVYASPLTMPLTVTSQDTVGTVITGYYVVLFNAASQIVDAGWTPKTFNIDTLQSYTLLVDDFANLQFSHWVDTGSNNRYRALPMGSVLVPSTIIAVFTDISGIPPNGAQISVDSVNTLRVQISGYYASLWQNCQDQTNWQNCIFVGSCFTPCNFLVTQGQTYQVAVADFAPEFFTMWSDLSLNRFHSVTVASGTTTISLTAVYAP